MAQNFLYARKKKGAIDSKMKNFFYRQRQKMN
jgi:hypothetical protein